MKNKCKTCGLSEWTHKYGYSQKICGKFTPEDDGECNWCLGKGCKRCDARKQNQGCGKPIVMWKGHHRKWNCGEIGTTGKPKGFHSKCSKSEIEPKGNIKPSDTFCLKDEREKLFNSHIHKNEPCSIGCVVNIKYQIEKQDKEFIKILKKDLRHIVQHSPDQWEMDKKIDKRAGDL